MNYKSTIIILNIHSLSDESELTIFTELYLLSQDDSQTQNLEHGKVERTQLHLLVLHLLPETLN